MSREDKRKRLRASGASSHSKTISRAQRVLENVLNLPPILHRLPADMVLSILTFLSSRDQIRFHFILVRYAPSEMMKQHRLDVLRGLYTQLVERDFSSFDLQMLPAPLVSAYLHQGLYQTQVLRLGLLETISISDWKAMMTVMPLRVLDITQQNTEFNAFDHVQQVKRLDRLKSLRCHVMLPPSQGQQAQAIPWIQRVFLDLSTHSLRVFDVCIETPVVDTDVFWSVAQLHTLLENQPRLETLSLSTRIWDEEPIFATLAQQKAHSLTEIQLRAFLESEHAQVDQSFVFPQWIPLLEQQMHLRCLSLRLFNDDSDEWGGDRVVFRPSQHHADYSIFEMIPQSSVSTAVFPNDDSILSLLSCDLLRWRQWSKLQLVVSNPNDFIQRLVHWVENQIKETPQKHYAIQRLKLFRHFEHDEHATWPHLFSIDTLRQLKRVFPMLVRVVARFDQDNEYRLHVDWRQTTTRKPYVRSRDFSFQTLLPWLTVFNDYQDIRMQSGEWNHFHVDVLHHIVQTQKQHRLTHLVIRHQSPWLGGETCLQRLETSLAPEWQHEQRVVRFETLESWWSRIQWQHLHLDALALIFLPIHVDALRRQTQWRHVALNILGFCPADWVLSWTNVEFAQLTVDSRASAGSIKDRTAGVDNEAIAQWLSVALKLATLHVVSQPSAIQCDRAGRFEWNSTSLLSCTFNLDQKFIYIQDVQRILHGCPQLTELTIFTAGPDEVSFRHVWMCNTREQERLITHIHQRSTHDFTLRLLFHTDFTIRWHPTKEQTQDMLLDRWPIRHVVSRPGVRVDLVRIVLPDLGYTKEWTWSQDHILYDSQVVDWIRYLSKTLPIVFASPDEWESIVREAKIKDKRLMYLQWSGFVDTIWDIQTQTLDYFKVEGTQGIGHAWQDMQKTLQDFHVTFLDPYETWPSIAVPIGWPWSVIQRALYCHLRALNPDVSVRSIASRVWSTDTDWIRNYGRFISHVLQTIEMSDSLAKPAALAKPVLLDKTSTHAVVGWREGIHTPKIQDPKLQTLPFVPITRPSSSSLLPRHIQPLEHRVQRYWKHHNWTRQDQREWQALRRKWNQQIVAQFMSEQRQRLLDQIVLERHIHSWFTTSGWRVSTDPDRRGIQAAAAWMQIQKAKPMVHTWTSHHGVVRALTQHQDRFSIRLAPNTAPALRLRILNVLQKLLFRLWPQARVVTVL